jgi:hypothetical protein
MIKSKIRELKEAYELSKSLHIIFETLRLFDDWLLVHIMEYDKKYVKLFNSKGLV